MQDEQVQRIESKIDVLDGRVGRIESRLHGVDSRLDALDGRVGRMGQELKDLRQDMHVLHEDLVDRIKALAPDFGPIRREFRGEIAELRESTDRRLVPLEAAERTRRRPKR